MDILFATEKLRKLLTDDKRRVRKFGVENARKIKVRLDDFDAAPNLETLSSLPHHRLHPLTGDRKGTFAIDVRHPFRMIIEPVNDPVPHKDTGGIDYRKITCIRIIEIIDYH